MIILPNRRKAFRTIPGGDPYFGSVVLLISGQGTNGSTPSNADLKGHTVTWHGNAQITTGVTDPFGASTGVIAVDGTGDWLSLAATSDFGMSTGAFTLEAWIKATVVAGSDRGIIDLRSAFAVNNGTFFIDITTGKLAFYDGTALRGATGTAISTATWYYVGATYDGAGTLKGWRNGSVDFTASVGAMDIGTPKPCGIGASDVGAGGSSPFNGYFGPIRITKGIARDLSSVPTGMFPTF